MQEKLRFDTLDSGTLNYKKNYEFRETFDRVTLMVMGRKKSCYCGAF